MNSTSIFITSFVLKEELKQVKKRNKQLCFILGQGESKSLASSLCKFGLDVTLVILGHIAMVRPFNRDSMTACYSADTL